MPQSLNPNTICYLDQLLGDDIASKELAKHLKLDFTKDEKGRGSINLNYNGEDVTFSLRAILGYYFYHLHSRLSEVFPTEKIHSAVPVPPVADVSLKRAFIDAAHIGGVDPSLLSIVHADDALVAAYSRKISVIRSEDREALNGKNVCLIEMGHAHTTILVVQVNPDAPHVVKKTCVFDNNLGAVNFDFRIFDHFSEICKSKTGAGVTPGSKAGKRLLAGCEKIRKLLSQIKESRVTVENLTDAGDASFDLTRDKLAEICSDVLSKFKEHLNTALNCAISASDVAAVEILGGGLRMQVVQAIVTEVFGVEMTLGAKLDDSSVAYGAALAVSSELQSQATAAAEKLKLPSDEKKDSETEIAPEDGATNASGTEEAVGVISKGEEYGDNCLGFTAEEIEAAKAAERIMQERDFEIIKVQAARNDLEAFIFEMRGAPRRKYGELIKADELNKLMEECESWLWDNPDVSLDALEEQSKRVRSEASIFCKEFDDANEKEKLALEATLKEESAKAEAERAAEGEEDDHDNRKLKKEDRMRMVIKNKEEGTELFKGGNYRPAAARYHKSLTHASKFFDLSPDDEQEVKAVKLSLYLNLAQCYIKLENYDNVIRNCDEALSIEPNNAKALFRRATAYETKKDWDKALEDLKKAALANPDDKAIPKAEERIKRMVAKEKAKDKKIWGNAFSKA